MRRFLLGLSMLLLSLPLYAAQVIELIPLKSQLPQNIIPVIQPLLSQGDAISSMNNQLIIKVDEAQLPRIRQLVEQLDSPPKRLLIEVRHSGDGIGNLSDYNVSARVNAGDGNLRLNENRGRPYDYDVGARISTSDSNVNVKIKQRRTENQFDDNQVIQATEGFPALIRYGQVIPYQVHDYRYDGRYVRRDRYTEFLDATSGVFVIPRLNGDQVSLEIEQQRNRAYGYNNDFARQRGNLSVQSSSTFVTGRLGDWIRLGGIGESNTSREQGVVSRRTTDLSKDQQIMVRVTLAP